MKKHITILLFLPVLCLVNRTSFSQECTYIWSQQNSGTLQLLYTCKAVNELVCWAAGANATVLRTTDGGDTWLNANPNPGIIIGDIRNMEAIDENTALVTTESQTSTSVYRTSNGGNSWIEVYSNTDGFIKGIRMLDSMNGIAVGNPVMEQPNVLLWNILLTTDGGNTWQSSPNRPSANNIHQAVHNSFQVSMPYIYWGTSFTTIFRSTDGGITYTENETPGAGIYVFSIFINSGGVGFAAATGMSRSTDGGVTFQSHSVPGAGNINGIESSGSNFWYIRGYKIYHSTDDGISWTDEYTVTSSLTHIDFPDNLNDCQMGWAVGYGGTIHKMTSSMVTSVNYEGEIPDIFELKQNYPNPFNPTTGIQYLIGSQQYVTLKVFDLLGREVATLVNEEKQPGTYDVEFNASELPSGIFFYRLTAGNFTDTKKMIIMK